MPTTLHGNPRQACLASLRQLLENPEPGPALFEAALWIAAEHDSALQPAQVLRDIASLQQEVSLGLPNLPANEMAQALLRRLTNLGFQQDELGPLRPHAALLHKVLQRRRGQPLCLALLTLELARRLDIALVGVGFPGHFLLRVPGADHLLDPCGGRRLYPQDCRELLARQFGPDTPLQAEHMRAVDGPGMLQRLSRNLRHLHLVNNDPMAALKDAERVMELAPPMVADYLARADIYRQLDCPQAERFDLECALLLTDEPLQSLQLTQRLQRLQAHPSTGAKVLH